MNIYIQWFYFEKIKKIILIYVIAEMFIKDEVVNKKIKITNLH